MLNLVKGHRVSLVENLFETFTKLTEHHLMANVQNIRGFSTLYCNS